MAELVGVLDKLSRVSHIRTLSLQGSYNTKSGGELNVLAALEPEQFTDFLKYLTLDLD